MEEPPEKELHSASPLQIAGPSCQAPEVASDSDAYEFDVFVSYATDPDYSLARQLESFIETFHHLPTPGNLTLRPLRVCVDGSDFKSARWDGEDGEVNEVGSIIEHYLARSRALLVLCSKNARRSPWVDQELRWFITNRSRDAVMLALTEGTEPDRLGEVFPPAVVEAGLHKRIAYDFRGARRRGRQRLHALRDYEDERTRLAADLYGRPASEIRPIWFREQRRQARARTRLFISVTAVLSGLLMAAIYFYLNAAAERENAIAEAERTRRQSYVATVNFARRALDEGSASLARQLLEAQRPGEGQEDLRDFEWSHLLRRASPEKLRLRAKNITLITTSVSPDGRLIAAAGDSRIPTENEDPTDAPPHPEKATDDEPKPPQSVYVWSLDGGELKHVLKGHTGTVRAVKFSPTSSILLSGGDDGLKIWDATTGAQTRSIKLPAVEHLAFSPDGRVAAIVHETYSTLLDAATWKELGQLVAPPGDFVFAFAFSPDGKQLVAGGAHNKIHLWDVARRKRIRALGSHSDNVLSAAWSARTNLLATGGAQGQVILWDMSGPRELARLPQGDAARALAFSPDGRLLAVGLGDLADVESGKNILLWDVPTRTLRGLFKGHGGRVESLEFTPSGEALVSTGEEDVARVWDVQTASFLSFFSHDSPVESLEFSRDGRLMAVGGYNGVIRVWTLDGSVPPVTLRESDWFVGGLSFDPSGRLVWLTLDDSGDLRLWDPASGAPSTRLPTPELPWMSVQFSPGGNTLAATTCEGDIYLWEWPGLALLWQTNQGGCPTFVAWSPDGRYVAAGGGDPGSPSTTSVFIWRVGDNKPLSVLSHDSWPTDAAFSPDGKHLVTGSWDGEIIIWDFAAGAARHRMLGHTGKVSKVAYSPSGRVVASASEDESVRVWDVVTGQERLALRDSQQDMLTLAFHPTGKALAAAGSFYPPVKTTPRLIGYKPTGMIILWAGVDSTLIEPQR
jgi:WD40 repeat protein